MKLLPLCYRNGKRAWLGACAGAVILLACGIFPANAGAASDSPQPMSLEQYRAELQRVEKAIEDQRDHFQPPAGSEEKLNIELPEVWYVEAQGQRYEVPTSELKFTIEDKADRAVQRVMIFKADLERLGALEKESEKLEGAKGAAGAASAEDARGKLKEILSHREFDKSQERKSWIGELWDKIVEWIFNAIERLFTAVRGNKPVRNIVLYGVIVLGFVALAWILIRVLGGVARRENFRLEPAAFPVKTSGQWTREAMAAAARGNYREAIHCGYWAGVYRLAEMGIWELDPSRTPREYLRLLSARPRDDAGYAQGSTPEASGMLPDPAARAARAQALSALTRSFESVWYADEPATQQDFTSAVAQLETLECRLPSTARTAGS